MIEGPPRRGIDLVWNALPPNAPHNLLVGAPCFDPPGELRDALARAARVRNWDYSSSQGSAALRDAIVRLRARRGEEWSPGQVFVTQGSKLAVLAVLGTLLRPGDEVVVPTPGYGPYRSAPPLFGATVIPVPRSAPDFAFDADRIASAFTPKTRAVILSSPCNPTGAILRAEEERRLAEAVRAQGAYLVMDLAYENFRYAGGRNEAPPPSPAPGADGDPVIRIHSFSKTFGVCGWRMGYTLADAELVRAFTAFQAAHLNPPNTIVQDALVSAPEVPDSFLASARQCVRSRVDALLSALSDTALPAPDPEGGFCLFADATEAMRLTGAADALSFCTRLAREAGVGFTPGTDFGTPGHVRISATGLARPADAPDLADRLRRFLSA
jgi:aspartate/methionine/tyrosine aminotransferase